MHITVYLYYSARKGYTVHLYLEDYETINYATTVSKITHTLPAGNTKTVFVYDAAGNQEDDGSEEDVDDGEPSDDWEESSE
jgi:hypothetical protein